MGYCWIIIEVNSNAILPFKSCVLIILTELKTELSTATICNYVALFPFNVGWKIAGTVPFLKLMLQNAIPLTFMGIELHGCIFLADLFNLSKIHHDFVSVILQTKVLAPISTKLFTSRLWMSKCFLKLFLFYDNFICRMFNWYVSFWLPFPPLLAPSILLSSISIPGYTFIYYSIFLAAHIVEIINFNTIQAVWIYRFKLLFFDWFERLTPYVAFLFIVVLFCIITSPNVAIWVWSQLVYCSTWNFLFLAATLLCFIPFWQNSCKF